MEMKNSSVSPSKYGEVPDGQYADDTAASAGAFGVAAGVLSDEELEMISTLQTGNDQSLLIQWLTLAWSIKEAMFKWESNGRIDFRKHLQINQISREGNVFIADCILQKENPVALKVHGLLFNGNVLTWLVT